MRNTDGSFWFGYFSGVWAMTIAWCLVEWMGK